jgi:hypothetical protein
MHGLFAIHRSVEGANGASLPPHPNVALSRSRLVAAYCMAICDNPKLTAADFGGQAA